MRNRPHARRLTLIVTLTALAFATYLLGKFLSVRGMIYAGAFGGIAAFAVAVVTALGPLVVRWWSSPATFSSLSVTQAANDLAARLNLQWLLDETMRRVNDPRPLPVRWEVVGTAEDPAQDLYLRGSGVGSPFTADLPCHFPEIFSLFAKVPSRRLVILGSAGAGKSVLAQKLAHDMLYIRENDQPVPVILPAANMDLSDGILAWISTWLADSFTSFSARLRVPGGEAISVARALVDSGKILPIIDGLDELPEYVRAEALSKINAVGSDVSLVLTSRPAEYMSAATECGRPVAQALEIQLLPLDIDEVQAYLRETVPTGGWGEVFSQLAAEPSGPLAAVLTTPLMLWLCRTIYEGSRRDPSELTDKDKLPDREAIESHLLDELLPAVYPGRRTSRSRYRWKAAQARRWLAFLATFLDDTGSPNLAWWQLSQAVAPGWRALIAGIRTTLLAAAAWGLGAYVLWRHGDWVHGMYVDHTSVRALLLSGPEGSHLIPAVNQSLVIFKRLGAARILLRISSAVSLHSLPIFAVKLGIAGGVLALLAGTRKTKPDNVMPASIRFRRSPRLLMLEISRYFILYGIIGLVLALELHSFLLVLVMLVLSLSPALAGAFRATADISQTASPVGVLWLDRRATITLKLVGYAGTPIVVFLFCGLDVAVADVALVLAGLLCAVFLGEGWSSASSASATFAGTRIVLACSRRLPWRAMRFLADAHRRGVLRQTGAVYQFRHARLQEQLSQQQAGWLSTWTGVLLGILDTYVHSILSSHELASETWLPRSTAPQFQRVWSHRFLEAIAALPPELRSMSPAGGIYPAGPGLAMRAHLAANGSEWVVCGLPGWAPVVVARPVWEALKDTGTQMAGGDAFTILGLPFLDREVPLGQRIIGADATHVMLMEGSWSYGSLIRDSPDGDWRWELRSGVGGHSSEYTLRRSFGRKANSIKMVAKVTISLPSQLTAQIPRQANEKLSRMARDNELPNAVSAMYSSLGVEAPSAAMRNSRVEAAYNQVRAGFTILPGRAKPTATAMIGLSLQKGARTRPKMQAETEIDAYGILQAIRGALGGTNDEQRLLLLDTLAHLLAAAWGTSANALLSAASAIPAVHAASANVELALIVPRRFNESADYGALAPMLGLGESRVAAWIGGPLRLTSSERYNYARQALAEISWELGFSVPDEWERSDHP